MPRIVRRAEWGARIPRTPFEHVPIAARNASCVHHDGAHPISVKTFTQAVALVRRDEAYHIDHNGWNGIGYNYLTVSAPGTPVDGLIFEGRGRDVIGAHCLNYNRPWIGIQVAIGGGQQPSPAALASVRWLHDTFTAAAGHTLAKKGHSDGFNTACPGPILLAWVRAGMPATNTPPTTPPETDVPLTEQEINTISIKVAEQVWNRYTVNGFTLQQTLGRLLSATNPAVFAAAVVKALPAGGSPDAAAIEAAVRVVFKDAATK